MTIPNLKRIKIASVKDLRSWLATRGTEYQEVMILTVAQPGRGRPIDRRDVAQALSDAGWRAGSGYTLNGGLRGQVIAKDAR